MTASSDVNLSQDYLPEEIELWVTCSSFEERCLSAIKEKSRIKEISIFSAEQFEHLSKKNTEILTSEFHKNSSRFHFDLDNPTSFADSLIECLENQKEKKIVFDISTFPRESILIILKYINLFKHDFCKVWLYYRCASVSESLSKGVVQIRSIIGYMGDISPDKSTHLIILSGFEHERAKEIISCLEPDKISIGYGEREGSINSELHEKNIEFTTKLKAYFSDENISTFGHSLKNPEEAKSVILEIVDSLPQHNCVIAPLNNKLSTIGAGMAAISRPDVQMCYAQMMDYNPNYSKPLDESIIYKVD